MSDEKQFCVSVDLPGVKKDDITVDVENGAVNIRGTRFFRNGTTVEKSNFTKSFGVDTNTVDLSKLTANLADGVLVESAPEKARAEPVSITITTEPHKAIGVSPDDKTVKA